MSTVARIGGVLLTLGTIAVGVVTARRWVEEERREAAATAREETLAEVRAALRDAVREIDRSAGTADRILSPMPVMTPAEEAGLRRYLAASHLARARAAGTRVLDEARLDSLLEAGALVELQDSTAHWVVRPGTAPAIVVPSMPVLLHTLGRRFHARLAELELPLYRIEVTSALRTAEHQARLRRTNSNAASGVSAHEFGATVDLSYAAFAPPAQPPVAISLAGSDPLRPTLDRLTQLAFESVSGRKSRELGRIFSEELQRAQDEGLALVIYERQQTVYHLTVAEVDRTVVE